MDNLLKKLIEYNKTLGDWHSRISVEDMILKAAVGNIYNDLKKILESEQTTKSDTSNTNLDIADVSHSTSSKPPLGLRPENIAVQERRDEIFAAVWRYVQARKKIPQEWIDEFNSYCG